MSIAVLTRVLILIVAVIVFWLAIRRSKSGSLEDDEDWSSDDSATESTVDKAEHPDSADRDEQDDAEVEHPDGADGDEQDEADDPED